MKALNPRLTHEYGRGWILSVEVDADSVPSAKQVVDRFRDGYMNVDVTRYTEKRSLQANAYFHVLCDRIADATKSTLDEVKVMLVQRYGTLERGKDGKYMAAKVPANTDITAIYPYTKHIGQDENGLDMYLFYKRTSTLDKQEMGRLIDGTVEEARALNLETMPPQELERMMNAWRPGK